MVEPIKTIKVIFIRHAETEENVRVKNFIEIIKQLFRLKLPTIHQLWSVAMLLRMDWDAEVSSLGSRQITDISMTLSESKVWKEFDYDIVLYSPFKRTKDTCLKIIPTNKHQKCLALDALKEVSPVENLLNWNVKEKIEQFEKYLFENSYNNVVVVGHSKYLKRMIKTDEMMRNCDVWSASVKFFTKPNGGADTWEASWSQAMLLHRTELAEAHPIDKLFSFSGLKKLFIGQPRSSGINNSDNSDDQSVKEDDDTEPDPSEPTCRICQMTQKESPESRLFRPCKCSGSVSYVHISCLNQWRATSTDAFYQCSICKYRYQIERTFLAEFLMKENSIVILCIVMILVAVILSGALLNQSVKYLGSNNIVLADIILQHLEVQPIWKSPVCQQFSINTIIHNIYVMYKHDYNLMVKAYIQLVFYTSVLWFWLACLPLFARVIDILLIGTAVVACLGFSLYVYHELLLLRFGDQRMMMHVGMVAGWFASLGNRAFARMTLLIGCVIAFRQVYNSMQVAARQFSSWLGDRILEPHDLQ